VGDDGSCDIQVTADDWSLRLRCASGRWTVSDPGAPVIVAVSGGWTDPGTLTIVVAFLETLNRLVLTCSLPDRTFRARWGATGPFRGGPRRTWPFTLTAF
jgi:hypothetical protein